MGVLDWFDDLVDAILTPVKRWFNTYILGAYSWISGSIAGIVFYCRDGILDTLGVVTDHVYYCRDGILEKLSPIPDAVWDILEDRLESMVDDYYEVYPEERGS